jgi:tetratricopeptide (TPR) repeat protein
VEHSSQQQLEREATQLAESHQALLAEARNLVQTGRGDEAINLYRASHRELQTFHDKWNSEIQSGELSLADWWPQFMADQEAALLTFEGLALRWMGKLDEAGALSERALALTPKETLEHASRLHGLGGIRYDQQAFAEGEELLRRAHAEYALIATNVAQTEPASAPQFWSQSAQALADSAHAALGRGNNAGFEKGFKEAIDFAEQHLLPDLANKLWLRQASVLLEVDASGETTQRVYAEGEQRISQSNDPEFKFEALLLFGEYYRVCGEPDLARDTWEAALKIAPEHRKWMLLRQLADIAETQGDAQATEDYSQAALAEARHRGIPQAVIASLRALVSLHAADNPYEAERYLSELRALGDKDEIKNALVARAFIYCQQKRFELALQDVEEAERATPEDPGVLLTRVAVLRGMDAKEEALRAIEKAVAAFSEQIRRGGADWKSGFDSLGALHESGARLAAELGRTEEAFVWAEGGKALRLRSRFVEPTDVAKTADISYSALRERLLAESATLLFFSVTHRGTLALLCDPHVDKPQSFFLDLDEQALADLLPTDLQDMPWNAAVFDALRPLSEKLAPCLRKAVGRKETRTLYIVPDSQLYFVPFAALDVDDSSKVIDHCAVIYLPCAAMLVSHRRPEVTSRTCLAAGAGREHGFSLSEQAAQIAALGWDTAECLMEASARDVLHKAPHFNVLHLQCHGQIESSLPGTRSASILELAGSSLSAKDVYGLSLTAELVFLNACVSGRFRSRLSSEVGGFWEAFVHAGASGVIVTSTYVDPELAQRLALAFYRHWLNGKGSGEALRQAQLEIREEKPEPYNWATHILIGVG